MPGGAQKQATVSGPDPAPPQPEEDTQQRARRWLRVLLLASLACLLIVVASEFPQPNFRNEPPLHSHPPARDDELIIPGQRVGFLYLGIPIAEVESRLGRGHAKPTQTAVLYRFEKAGLTCAVQKGLVTSILVHNPRFMTTGKTAVGSDADQVVREFGDQYEYETMERPQEGNTPPKPVGYTLHYWREGIHLNLKADQVDSILVTTSTGG